LEGGEKLAAILTLVDRSLATSGNYRNVYEIDGVTVGHTLDPRTGRPAVNEVRSATVVADDCRSADGWATALMVLGTEGLPLVEASAPIEAMLLVEGAEGITEVSTTGMGRYRNPAP
jgi:thiamine biosynthesis lipoprotein